MFNRLRHRMIALGALLAWAVLPAGAAPGGALLVRVPSAAQVRVNDGAAANATPQAPLRLGGLAPAIYRVRVESAASLWVGYVEVFAGQESAVTAVFPSTPILTTTPVTALAAPTPVKSAENPPLASPPTTAPKTADVTKPEVATPDMVKSGPKAGPSSGIQATKPGDAPTGDRVTPPVQVAMAPSVATPVAPVTIKPAAPPVAPTTPVLPESPKADPIKPSLAKPITTKPQGPVKGHDWTAPAAGMELVWIAAQGFWAGRYEVTNREFRRFRPDHRSGAYKGLSLDDEDQPAVNVSFRDAVAFAEWLTTTERQTGGLSDGLVFRLPDQYEWRALAQCGENRTYPWGSRWPPTTGNYADLSLKRQADGTSISGYDDGFAASAPVARSGANAWGLHGLGGNAMEWTTETLRLQRGVRGGGWRIYSGQRPLTCDYRDARAEDAREPDLGFRLVLGPDHP